MLPDFPAIKHELAKRWSRRLEEEVRRQTPLASRIASFRQHEGHAFSHETTDGEIETKEYISMQSEVSIPMSVTAAEAQQKMEDNISSTAADVAKQVEGL